MFLGELDAGGDVGGSRGDDDIAHEVAQGARVGWICGRAAGVVTVESADGVDEFFDAVWRLL